MRLIFLIILGLFSYCHSTIPQKVVICGVCRDVALYLPHTKKCMEQIGNLFADYRIIVYENNSADETPKLLTQWMENNHKVHVVSEFISKEEEEKLFINRLSNNKFYRPEMIARARNIVLDIAISDRYTEFPYLIWIDMDFKREPDFNGIKEVFETNKEWDAVIAYGIDPSEMFWDWYAFRDKTYPIGSELLGNTWWYMSKRFKLNPKNDWYRVYSAFGGCGIYKKTSIVGCRYSGIVNEDLEKCVKLIIGNESKKQPPIIKKYQDLINKLDKTITITKASSFLPKIFNPKIGIILHNRPNPIIWKMSSFVYQYPSVCEHVTFHAAMIIRGHDKIFINPRMIFRYGD